MSALALGLTLSGTATFAGCQTIGFNYPCTAATDETLNAGAGDNLVYSGGATGTLTVNGEGGNDSIVFGEASTLAPDTGTTLADGGTGDDKITVQDASTLSGNILGGADADNILVEEASSVTGDIDGGTGDDTLTLRDAGTTVTGDLIGGDGADAIILRDGSKLTGDVVAGIGADRITMQDAGTTATGDFIGGDGADVIMLRDASKLTGDIDTGIGDDKITLKLGATLDGYLLAGADIDTVLIRGASTVTGDVDLGDGADLLTIQESSLIKGSVLAGGGDDTLLLERGDTLGGSTIEGDFDAGAGNDSLRIRGGSTVKGDVLGGTGNDALLVTGSSTVEGGVDAGDDDDLVTIQDTSLVKGDVAGGAGKDSLLVEGNATVQGALSGGGGDDLLTVTSGAVQGGISGGDGDDTANLSGGTIGALAGPWSLDLGAGNDTLNLTFNDTLGADALDATALLSFDGGTGANTATLTGFDADYSEGGLFDRSFSRWDSVTLVGTHLQLSSDATITALNLTASSGLFQTEGLLALTGADGSDSATLSVDATSFVDLRDASVTTGPTVQSFSVPSSVANDSITVANLSLTGSATPLTLPTLRVDFDAADTTHRNGRDDAFRGNADEIAVSNGITTSGSIGIQIDAVGGYLNLGRPAGLSGSVALIDDLQSAALARPGVSATLVASTTYVASSNLPVDPRFQWALVDQGNGGVYLQWTTSIDGLTVGPNAGAELAVASGGVETMSAVLSGLADGSLAKRPICAAADCAAAPVSVWVLAGGSALDMGSVDGFEGFDTSTRSLTGGVDYATGGPLSGGLFASLQRGSTDLGTSQDLFGLHASEADHTAAFIGGYVKAEQNGTYLTALGALGKASTDLTNGTLFDATSSHDSLVTMIGATAGQRVALGGGFVLDPRAEASYVTSDGSTYTDSQGLTVNSSASQTRVAATLGLSYERAASPLSLTLRAGTAFLVSDTETTAAEEGAGALAGVAGHRSDKVFTASLEGRWTLTENATLIGSISADSGDDIDAARGGIKFTYAF